MGQKQKSIIVVCSDGDKGFAQELAGRVGKDDNNIDGMFVAIRVISVAETFLTNDVSGILAGNRMNPCFNPPVLRCHK